MKDYEDIKTLLFNLLGINGISGFEDSMIKTIINELVYLPDYHNSNRDNTNVRAAKGFSRVLMDSGSNPRFSIGVWVNSILSYFS